jgi:hypothetical protein
MGKENKIKKVDVFCRSGHLLFEDYRKVGGGRLLKAYQDEIGEDHTESGELPPHAVIYCRECDPPRPVATVEMIHGRVAYEIIQPGIRKVVT